VILRERDMSRPLPTSYFVRRSRWLRRIFARSTRVSAEVMRERGHAPELIAQISDEARAHFDAILPRLSDPGRAGAHLRSFTVGASIQLAFYLAMKAHGHGAAEAWAICEETARRQITRVPRFLRAIISAVFFSAWMQRRFRRAAMKSLAAPLGGWQFEYVEGARAGEFGVTYTRCALQALARALDASEFGPYLCLGDIVASDVLGWGVQRSETLGHGCARCNFRFTRGGNTQISTPATLQLAPPHKLPPTT
jgi:hypothetical protein